MRIRSPLMLALMLLLLGPAASPKDLREEVKGMEQLATELTQSIAKVQQDMQQFVKTSQASRSGAGGAGGEVSTDPLVQGLEGLKGVVYRVLEQTDINNNLMDSIEATIAEVKHRKARAEGFGGDASTGFVKRWEESLVSLQKQKEGILTLRTQAQNNLTELLAKETLILELADLQDLESITAQLDSLTSGLSALSESMRKVSGTVVPVETGLPH